MKTLVSWSTGKDSAWMLHRLQGQREHEVAGLFCTINKDAARTAMHAVRVELLHLQAERAGLPLDIIELPWPCSNNEYEAIMGEFVKTAQNRDIECFAFGDLLLEDVRNYRTGNLKDTGITPVFPVWGENTDKLAREMIAGGQQAVITCVDPAQLDKRFAGQVFDSEFLDGLPASVDPCGENGEFHTFVFDAPVFSHRIDIAVTETVERDGFVFTDVVPAAAQQHRSS